MKLTYFFYNTVYILAFIMSVMSMGTMFGGRDDEAMVYLPQKDAALVEKALEYVLNRAPRQDAPQLGDSEFPVFDLDLSDIRRILCTIKSQLSKVCDKLEDIQADLSAHDMFLEDCCSVIEEIEYKIGYKTDTYEGPPDGKYANSNTEYSIYQWLKAIYCMIADTGT